MTTTDRLAGLSEKYVSSIRVTNTGFYDSFDPNIPWLAGVELELPTRMLEEYLDITNQQDLQDFPNAVDFWKAVNLKDLLGSENKPDGPNGDLEDQLDYLTGDNLHGTFIDSRREGKINFSIHDIPKPYREEDPT